MRSLRARARLAATATAFAASLLHVARTDRAEEPRGDRYREPLTVRLPGDDCALVVLHP
jgi:hypothetical protein